MVTMNHLSVEDPEDPEDASLLLPQAEDTVTPTPICSHRQQTLRHAEPRDFFLSRFVSAGLLYIYLLSAAALKLCCCFSFGAQECQPRPQPAAAARKLLGYSDPCVSPFGSSGIAERRLPRTQRPGRDTQFLLFTF